MFNLMQRLINHQKNLLGHYCSIYPYQVVKVVRLGLKEVEALLHSDSKYEVDFHYV